MSADHLKKRLLTIGYVLGLLGVAFVALSVLQFVQHAILLLAASVLLAYLLSPLVAWCSRPIVLRLPGGEPRVVLRQGLPWLWAVVTVYALFIGLVILLFSSVIPVGLHEFKNFMTSSSGLPALEAQTRGVIDSLKSWIVEHSPPEARDAVPGVLDTLTSELGAWAYGLVDKLPPLLGRALGTAFAVLVVPIMTFYLLLDIRQVKRGFMALFPLSRQGEIQDLLSKVDTVLGHYIRGQIIVAAILGASICVVLNLLGIRYALVIGLFAGIASLIPYVGPVVGGIPAALMALYLGGVAKLVAVVLAMYGVHLFEGKVVVPTVVGKSVGLPPIVIIFSLISGAELMGLVGMLLAVPTAGVIRVVVEHYLEKRNREIATELRLPRGEHHETTAAEGPPITLQRH